MKRISVIICAYALERWTHLVAAVVSIEQQSLPAHEIIVVIDHNPELLRQAQNFFSHAHVIENKEPRGLSGARNTGIGLATGDLVAFLDDDACAKPGWLQAMAAAFTDEHILGIGGPVEPSWEKNEPSWFPSEFRWVVGCSYTGMPQDEAPIRNPIGANMCIRSDVFQRVGGFRNGIGRVGTLPIGCEETELCIRARQQWPDQFFLYVPQVRVAHYVPRKRASWRYFMTRCYAEGISKAAIARFVGARDALSSEGSYTLQTLPAGVLRNLGDVFLHGHGSGLARAGAIVIGFTITAIGYLVGKCVPFSAAEEIIPVSADLIGQSTDIQEVLP